MHQNRSHSVPTTLLRRQMLQLTGAAVGAVVLSPAFGHSAAQGAERRGRTLVRPSEVAQLATRNKMVLELEGKLLVNEPDAASKKKNRNADVKAKSTVDFYELAAMDGESKVVAAAREYLQAEAEHWVDGNSSSSKLRDACKQTVLVRHQNQWQQFCQAEPMLVTEVELLLAP